MVAEVGDLAPGFILPAADNTKFTLDQFRDKKYVVLSFHIFNFTSG